jgi:site-specific DNA-methyltransferase (cytosine-N4-specific)
MTCDKERSSLEKKYNRKIVEELELGSYISYTMNKRIPFLNIYTFEEAFSVPLVCELLNKVEAHESDCVFDPFCGSGTTLFTCVVNSIPSVGIDALPLAHFLSQTLPQFLFLKEGEITSTWNSLLPTIEGCEPAPVAVDVPIMRAAFKKNIFLKLRKMKTAITEMEEPYNNIFLLLFFSILEECSNTVKKKRYPIVVKKKICSDPIDAMNKKVRMVENDVVQAKKYCIRKENLPEVILADTKDISGILKRNPTVLITSPPYADTVDYVRSYALELCFHFVKNDKEFRKLSHHVLRSFITSQRGEKEGAPHPAVEEIADALHRRAPRVQDMVTAYFADMNEVIHQWWEVLGTQAAVAVVLDNLVYKGVAIPVDLVLSDMAEEAGFTVERIIVANYRGKKVPVRESILMWRK